MFENQQVTGAPMQSLTSAAVQALAGVEKNREKELEIIAQRIEGGNAAIREAAEDLESLAGRIWGEAPGGPASGENAKPVAGYSGRIDAALAYESDLLKRLQTAVRRLAQFA